MGASPVPYSMPAPEFFTGDLHNWVNAAGRMIQVYDPSSTTLVNGAYQRTPYPNNQIPQTQFDTVAKAINAYVQPLLKPNVPNLVPGTSGYVRNNYISYGTTLAPNDKYSIKADQVITARQRIAFLFGRTREQDFAGMALRPLSLGGNPATPVRHYRIDVTLSPPG